MSCSFLNIVGGICGADERTSSSTSVTPLTRCNRDIKNHKKSLKFSGIETEVELILARCGCFQKPANLSDMTICPVHRAKLGLGWRRTGNLWRGGRREEDVDWMGGQPSPWQPKLDSS